MNSKHSSKNDSYSELENLNWLEGYIKSFWAFLPIAACYVNPAFNILEISHTLKKLSGFRMLEIIGQGLGRLFAESQEFKRIEKEIQEKGAVQNKEATFLSKKGEQFSVSISGLARKDEQGNVVGYFFAFLDITESKKFEQELKEKIEDLEKFRKLTEGRELRMIELKEEIHHLQEEVNKLQQKKKN